MTPAQYFGIDNTAARIFQGGDFDSSCGNISSLYSLSSPSQEYHLNRISIADHCTDVNDSFRNGNEPAGERSYLWAIVDDNGHLTSRIRPFDNVEVLPEINFPGQDSYLYINPPSTTQSVVISAYNRDDNNPGSIEVEVRRGIMADGITTSSVTLNTEVLPHSDNTSSMEFSSTGLYPISLGSQRGRTITHWLGLGTSVKDDEGTTMAWHPDAVSLRPMEGGVIRDGGSNIEYKYAIGPNNNIDVRVAAENDNITRVNQVWLYDVENPRRPISVSSVIAGRTYYLIPQFETSNDDVEIDVSTNGGRLCNGGNFTYHCRSHGFNVK